MLLLAGASTWEDDGAAVARNVFRFKSAAPFIVVVGFLGE